MHFKYWNKDTSGITSAARPEVTWQSDVLELGFIHTLFVLLFVMGKDIGRIYKYSLSKILTSSLKSPVISSSDPQTSSSTELTAASVPSVRNKNQNNHVLYSQNTIQNGASIKNNCDIYSCETAKKQKYSIPTISTPNKHTQRIAKTSSSTYHITSGW